MAEQDLGAMGEVIARATDTGSIVSLVGRISLVFPEYDADKREVFEVPEIKRWLDHVENKYAYFCVLAEPTSTFKILMFCHAPWKREGRKNQIVADPDRTMGYLLESGMVAFAFAKWQTLDAKRFAELHLTRIGLKDEINPGSLDDYEQTYQQRET